MNPLNIYVINSLEKVFPNQKPKVGFKIPKKVLQGEKIQFQLVYHAENKQGGETKVQGQVTITGFPANFFEVGLVPSELPVWPSYDENYLTTDPGLFPDVLRPSKGEISFLQGQYRSLWVTIDTKEIDPGLKEGQLSVYLNENQEIFSYPIAFEVCKEEVVTPNFYHTEWFHVDSLLHYYHLTPYDGKCWDYLENFVAFAAKNCGINTLLTPIFTSPLDTEVGKERTNVQLLKIKHGNNQFDFDFENVRRWLKMCQRNGIQYIEFPHLFTQWGAKATPNIYLEDGTKIFGWHIKATSSLYRQFLKTLIPQLVAVAKEEGYDQRHLIFHLSDEPKDTHLENYKKAYQQAADLLENYKVVDALSHYDFYQKGLVRYPVVANDALDPFLENKVPGLWTYYCCAQTLEVPNRFFSLPSYRNRVMGILIYLYQIEGFLHWGYNFYQTQFSKENINPYQVTDAGLAFPSGDPFLVYPGENGYPLSSIRNEVQMQGWQDLALLQQAEKIAGREKVVALIEEVAKGKPTFTNYPKETTWFDTLHEKLLTIITQK